VLLEALRIQGEGNCATVERFANYLKARVPQLTKRYKNYVQSPYVKVEPETKHHYILLPKFANLTDIALLREDALQAEIKEDFSLAFQLWMRVNVAAGGTDMKAINAFQRLADKQFSSNLPQKERVTDQGSKTPSDQQVTPPPSVPNKFRRESINRNPTSSPQISIPPSVPNRFKIEVIGSKFQTPLTEKINHPPVKLCSAKGINYQEMEKLLIINEWRKADELTLKIMLEVSNREEEGWLRNKDIQDFPYEDLQTIDQLWMYYSNNKFGFTIQKIIWLKCGGKIGRQDYQTWCKFAMQVGWYKPPKYFWNNEVWKTYTEFMGETNNASNAPTASLPSISTQFLAWTKDSMVIGWVGLSLLSRRDL
jgi:hypothetical protein